jgi:Tfp pilus assembly protein PilW
MKRFREEDGMTLMEVLVAATVGFIVLAATMGLLDSTVRLSGGVIAKTDAMQRGRLAMDRITQQLRSEVCLDLDTPAIATGATDSSVTFYADFSEANGTKLPEKRIISLSGGKITAQIFRTTTPGVYSATPSGSNFLLENVLLQKDDANKDLPFLKYYAYETVGGATPHPEATQVLATPLSKAAAARVARVEIRFKALPTGDKSTSTRGLNMTDQIVARHADPNLSVPDPACV